VVYKFDYDFDKVKQIIRIQLGLQGVCNETFTIHTMLASLPKDQSWKVHVHLLFLIYAYKS
jgi:hypothetical protein